jgi:hypothetical protein
MRGLAAHLLSALLLGSFFNSAVGWGVLFLDLVGRHKRGGEGGEEGGGGRKKFRPPGGPTRPGFWSCLGRGIVDRRERPGSFMDST